ncbi:hypothetical protein [Parasediminibacterium sp. JCM 36343]|uniref:hypothetical protein n=1 Tax=Parasediminibacterium sp. JCM 36343 TaxID=3374279 RepID=UPI003979658B
MAARKRNLFAWPTVLLAIVFGISCKHEAGVLDKCLGKDFTLDTASDHSIFDYGTDPSLPVHTSGYIIIDTLNI